MRLLISAGEASGEMYGAQLMEAMRRAYEHSPTVNSGATGVSPVEIKAEIEQRIAGEGARATRQLEFFGVGGEKMRAAGCDLIIDSRDLSVVGITEILSHLPKIWRLFHQLIAEADRRKPDLAIVIDSPAFNWRVARQMKKRGIPVVYYVCPQFWAWRQGRVRLLRKYVDKALVIFPFEEKFYRDRGVNAEFVGHPLSELPRPAISREEYAAEYELDSTKPWITLMPGSRVKEVRMNLPGMIESARLLGSGYEFLLPVAPTLDPIFMRELVDQARSGKGTASSRADSHTAERIGTTESRARLDSNNLALPVSPNRTDSHHIHLIHDALPALAHSRAGIIASGTATVEAAMMDLPFVMVYRVTPLTHLLGRSTVKVPHFAMVNLIAGKQVVPELVQEDFTPEKITAEVKNIIPDSEARKNMLAGLREVRHLLRGSEQSPVPPADRAAKAIFAIWQPRSVPQAR